MTDGSRTGGCLCGGVRFRVDGPLREIVTCYCKQCQRTSGNFVAATRVADADLSLERSETLAWYRSSAEAERGFCTRCGGNLFWRRLGAARTSIMAGTFDDTTGFAVGQQIYVADKACFHEIAPGTPAYAEEGPDIGPDLNVT